MEKFQLTIRLAAPMITGGGYMTLGVLDAPPYPSEPFYDAKLWTFAVEKGRKGALIWNVAGNQARMAKTN